jgi:hypothetical protein
LTAHAARVGLTSFLAAVAPSRSPAVGAQPLGQRVPLGDERLQVQPVQAVDRILPHTTSFPVRSVA